MMTDEERNEIDGSMRELAEQQVRAFCLDARNQLGMDAMVVVGTLYTKFSEVYPAKTIAEIVEKIVDYNDDFDIGEYAVKTDEQDDKIIYTFNDNSKLEIKK